MLATDPYWLAPVLAHEALRLETEIRPRIVTDACRSRLDDLTSRMRNGTWNRAVQRHPQASARCSLEFADLGSDDWLISPANRTNGRQTVVPRPEVKRGMAIPPPARLAFVIGMVMLEGGEVPSSLEHQLNAMAEEQLDRLLASLMRDADEHTFIFAIDRAPDTRGGARMRRTLALLSRLVEKHGPVKHWEVSAEVDVVYTGTGLLDTQLMAWRHLVAPHVPPCASRPPGSRTAPAPQPHRGHRSRIVAASWPHHGRIVAAPDRTRVAGCVGAAEPAAAALPHGGAGSRRGLCDQPDPVRLPPPLRALDLASGALTERAHAHTLPRTNPRGARGEPAGVPRPLRAARLAW